jgi:hypothetical protein
VDKDEKKDPQARTPPTPRRSRPGNLDPRLLDTTHRCRRDGDPENLIHSGGIDIEQAPPANPNLHLSTRWLKTTEVSSPTHRRRSNERRGERKPLSSAAADGRKDVALLFASLIASRTDGGEKKATRISGSWEVRLPMMQVVILKVRSHITKQSSTCILNDATEEHDSRYVLPSHAPDSQSMSPGSPKRAPGNQSHPW